MVVVVGVGVCVCVCVCVWGGGVGPEIKFLGKIWGKVQPSSPNKRKSLESSVTTRCKS